MNTYYFTFGQNHPLVDHWIEIIAANGEAARHRMVDNFGINWAFQYEDADFKPEYFPGGRAGKVLEGADRGCP